MYKRIFQTFFSVALVNFSINTWAGPGDGIRIDSPLGELVLHPFIDIEGGYDSNVIFDDNGKEKDDVFVSSRVGITHDRKELGIITLGGSAYYFVERYQDATQLDDEDFGFDVDLDINEAFEKVLPTIWDLRISLDAAYDEIQDVEFETGEIESKRELSLGAGVGKLFGFGEIAFGANYRKRDFGSESSSARFDDDEWVYQAKLRPKITDKTSGLLTVDWGQQEGQGIEDEDYYNVQAGLTSKRTDKTDFSLSIGYLKHDAGIDTISYDADIHWRATEKINVTLSGGNQIRPSISSTNNFSTEYHADLNIDYQATKSVSYLLSGGYVRNELKNEVLRVSPTTQQIQRGKVDSDTWTVTFRLNYSPPSSFFTLYGETSYQNRDSTLEDNNYEEYQFIAGIRLQY